MQAIREMITIDSDMIRIPALVAFRGRRVEVIILDRQDDSCHSSESPPTLTPETLERDFA